MEQLIEFAGNHAPLLAGFGVVLLLLIWTEISRYTRGYTELTPALAVQKINRQKTAVVDVSTSADFSRGHLDGARNIALSRFGEQDPDIEKIASDPILVVCKNGVTAHQAAAKLVKAGAKDVAVLKGGIAQWKADQYPLTRN